MPRPPLKTRRPRKATSTDRGRESKEWTAALQQGREHARFVLERRRERAARRRGARGLSAGLLVAEGDSWFDYPFFDVLEELEQGFNYSIESAAHKGDTIEEMAYDPNQLDKLARMLEKLAAQKRIPKAILLSGGGNDIAGEEFSVLLNHKQSALPALSEQVMAGLLDERLRWAIVTLAGAVTHLCDRSLGRIVPILIHGYDYPVPDGRGYLGGFWVLPGPWLAPGFQKKGYDDRHLRQRCDVMVTLIDRFNKVLAEIAGGSGLEHVRHVDLRRVISQVPDGTAYKNYKTWWGNELHPTEKGFARVAERFDATLRGL